jgi:hypothetical protein
VESTQFGFKAANVDLVVGDLHARGLRSETIDTSELALKSEAVGKLLVDIP